MTAPETVYLIDGSGYIFRAFYAVQPLSNSEGFPTNALFGFARMLLRILKEAPGGHLAVVFDAGRKTFRNDLYAEYKANRTECPEELLQQMPFFRELCTAVGLPVLEQPGFEADDIIATLTKKLTQAGRQVCIVSGDKDLMQLVSPQVSIWDTMKDKHYGPADVKEKFGVPPEQVIQVLALMGDSSDNVPGIDGVGPKTASQLVEKYGDVETLLTSVDAIESDSSIRNRKKIAETLRNNAELLRLCLKLVTVKDDVELVLNGATLVDGDVESSMVRQPPKIELMTELFQRFEFSSLLAEFAGVSAAATSPEGPAGTYKTVWADQFPAFCEQLARVPIFAFDTETTSLQPWEAQIIGASFCFDEDHAYYVPLAHTDTSGTQVRWDEFRTRLAPIFADPKIAKIGQNAKYDINVLATNGIEVRNVTFDTMVAAYILNPDRRGYNLTILAREHLNRGTIEFDQLVEKGSTFASVPIERATEYACQDAHYVWLLYPRLKEQLVAQDLYTLLNDVELPLIPILADIERTGIRVDTDLLSQMSDEFAGLLATLEEQIYAAAGTRFNTNSPKQLADVLFVQLGLSTKGLKKTKTGISTDSSVLEKLSEEHPLPGLILEYRTIAKLKSTYVDALPKSIVSRTGRIHTSLNQTITGTGRLSSSDPNLQNIPIQSAEGRRIRTAFIPNKGSIFISLDYSQIELRLLAHLSEDENLIASFESGKDIHAQTAREVLGLPPMFDVTPEERRVGKTINFGIVYGMGAFRLGRDLGIPVGQASQYINSYFARYPRVKAYFARLEQEMAEKDVVTTILGRKRFISSIDTSGRDQDFARRAAMNAPLQGSAADVIKLAMIRVDAFLRRSYPEVHMVLQVHDELLIEAPDRGSAANETLAKEIQQEMERVIELKVPLKVDYGIGLNWNEA